MWTPVHVQKWKGNSSWHSAMQIEYWWLFLYYRSHSFVTEFHVKERLPFRVGYKRKNTAIPDLHSEFWCWRWLVEIKVLFQSCFFSQCHVFQKLSSASLRWIWQRKMTSVTDKQLWSYKILKSWKMSFQKCERIIFFYAL